jgi:hypothetical protein
MLLAAIRATWIDLLESDKKKGAAIRELMKDEKFITGMRRALAARGETRISLHGVTRCQQLASMS